jgi:hypothetical protein
LQLVDGSFCFCNPYWSGTCNKTVCSSVHVRLKLSLYLIN